MLRNKRAFAVMALLMCVMSVFGSFGVFADEPAPTDPVGNELSTPPADENADNNAGEADLGNEGETPVVKPAYAVYVDANAEPEEMTDLEYANAYISEGYYLTDPDVAVNLKAAVRIIVDNAAKYKDKVNAANVAEYLEWCDDKSAAGESAAAALELMGITDEEYQNGKLDELTAEDFAKIVEAKIAEKAEAEAADAEAELLENAYAYLDGHADAIQIDDNVDNNVKDAIKEVQKQDTPLYGTIWSILPPVIAIALALITKEVYSSLFIGIFSGALLYANFNLEGAFNHMLSGGFVASLSDSYNVGILVFLVLLGALVAMMNKAGGSAAFGRWASTHIKTRLGAQLATIVLGCLIFVDDYFNCLTVGSVMRPVCDSKRVSRAKLSYLIDATAAPVCIIAPISSWAAAVAGFAPEGQGLKLFISAIPFNFYAILTIVMMVFLAVTKLDFGPMKKHEKNAEEKGDIFTTLDEKAKEAEEIQSVNAKGKVIDLVIPVVVLIICCIFGMIYSGGFFDAESDGYNDIITAFSNCDASVGLALGSVIAIIINVIYFVGIRLRVVKFGECMECIPEGFKAMVPAILILTFAWTLKAMTDSLGATVYIAQLVNEYATIVLPIIPAIIFLIAVGLSFSTGTSWGTFGILIPIVIAALGDIDNPLTIVAISACMAGAVCGDHCSPISDTTIMASAGAQCNHVNHVSTQLPYALTVAGVSFVSYIIAGFLPNVIVLPIAIVLMIGVLFAIKVITGKKAQ